MVTLQDIKLSKRLAQLVVEAGVSGIPEVKPVFEKFFAGRTRSDQKAFLKLFHKAVVRELKQDTLVIESTTGLNQQILDSLIQHFSQDRPRSLNVVEKANPDLIAGMRVQLGDTVYDASLAHSLQALANRIR